MTWTFSGNSRYGWGLGIWAAAGLLTTGALAAPTLFLDPGVTDSMIFRDYNTSPDSNISYNPGGASAPSQAISNGESTWTYSTGVSDPKIIYNDGAGTWDHGAYPYLRLRYHQNTPPPGISNMVIWEQNAAGGQGVIFPQSTAYVEAHTDVPNPSPTGAGFRIDPVGSAAAGNALALDYVMIDRAATRGLGEWDRSGDFNGWTTVNISSPAVAGSSLSGTGTGDAQLRSPGFDAGVYKLVEIRLQGTGSAAELFWAQGGAFTGSQQIDLGGHDGTFHTYVLDFSKESTWLGGNMQLRLDPATANGSTFSVDAVRVMAEPTYHWDANGAAAGTGGTGTWDTNMANRVWREDSTVGPLSYWHNAPYDDAVFAGTAGTVTIGGGGVTANDLSFQTDTYTVNGATLTLGGAAPVVEVTTGTSTIDSVVAGTTGLQKTGAGTLTLTGSNTYSGGTTISGGVLQVGNGGATGSLGTGTTLNNATLVWNNSNGLDVTSGNAISGTGDFTILSGVVRVQYQAGGSVSSGTVTVDGTGSGNNSSFEIWAPNPVTLNNDFVLNSMGPSANRGAINQDGGGGLVTLNGQITLAGDSRIGTGGGSWNSMVSNGLVTGGGKLYVWERHNANPSTELRLTNNSNDYSGGTEIEQGRLSVTQAGALGTGPVTITGANSQLLVDEITGTFPNDFTLGGGGNPTSTNYPYGNATMVFHNDAKTATLSGTVTLAGNAKIRHYSGGGTTIFNNPIGGTGDLTLEAGGAVPTHTQTWVLKGGNSTFAGNTLVRGDGSANAVLRLDGGALPSGTALTLEDRSFVGGNVTIFDLNGNNQTLAGLSRTAGAGGLGSFINNTSATASTLTINNAGTYAFSGVIGQNTTTGTTGIPAGGDNIALVKNGAGTLDLFGTNTYTDGTQINAGIIRVRNDGAYNGTVGSGPVNVAAGASLELWAPNAMTVPNDITLNGMGPGPNRPALNQDGGAGLVTVTGTVTLAADSDVGPGGSSWNDMRISGQITGPGKLVVKAANTVNSETLWLNGNNDYTGGTDVQSGRALLQKATGFGTGPVNIAAGSYVGFWVPGVSPTIANDFTLNGPGALQDGENKAALYGDGGGSYDSYTLTGTITLAADSNVGGFAGNDLHLSGKVTGPGGLTKGGGQNNDNTVTLSGNNDYAGMTDVSDGTLEVGGGSTVLSERVYVRGTSTPVFAVTGGTVTATMPQADDAFYVGEGGGNPGQLDVTGGTLNISGGRGLVVGWAGAPGAMNVNGAGAAVDVDNLVFGWNGTSTINLDDGLIDADTVRHQDAQNASFNLNGGTLRTNRIYNESNNGDASFTFNGGTIEAKQNGADLLGYGSKSRVLNVYVDDGGGTIDTAGLDVSIPLDIQAAGAATGGLTKTGAGTLTLSGSNSYGGRTDVNAGALRMTNGSSLGAGGFNATAWSWVYPGASLEMQGTWTTDEHLHIDGSGVGGAGAIHSLSGSQTVTSHIALDGPTATVGVDTGATLANNAQFYGASGSLTKVGGGTLVLNGPINPFHGDTNINAGTLVLNGELGTAAGTTTVAPGATLTGPGTVNGPLIVGGTVAPGSSPGTMTAGPTTWPGGGTYLWEINDADGLAGQDPGWDLLNVTGTLNVTAASGNPFTVNIDSLYPPGNNPGWPDGFFDQKGKWWSFPIAVAEQGVLGFDPTLFSLDAAGFVPIGDWAISATEDTVFLTFTSTVPEPNTMALLGLGLLGVLIARRRRA